MVLQDGSNDVALIRFEGGAEGGVGDFVKGVIVGDEDGDVLLKGEIGVDVAVGGEEGLELAEVLL